MKLLQHTLPYQPDSSELFDRLAHEEWAVFLDSGKPAGQYGRYDIIAARPFMTLTTRHGKTVIRHGAEETVHGAEHDPFTLLNPVLAAYPQEAATLPFSGGAIGYFGYDLGRYLEKLPAIASDAENIPDMCVGIYDWAVIVDHREQKTTLVSFGHDATTEAQWKSIIALFEAPHAQPVSAFRVTSVVASNLDQKAYADRFDRVKRYITEGDCYQVNLAQRFSAAAEGDAWVAYRHLRRISPAPFMAYMNFPQFQVLSGSPERFLQVSGRHVETRPIKGTRPRAQDSAEDENNARDLKSSLKDRAENLMIVDLLRNDISKSCRVGSVRADRLFALESFANVHHLVSTVTGTLADGKTAVDLLRGCFPGGSITGAPKLRAMEIIEELEPNRRGIYCGAIGYIGFDGNMDTNIAIRTAVYSNGEIRFWAGGGIVADSEMQREYRETWDKASSMLQLMQYFSDITDNTE